MKGLLGRIAAPLIALLARQKYPEVELTADPTLTGKFEMPTIGLPRWAHPRGKPKKRLGRALGPDSITFYDGCVSMWLKFGRRGPRPPRKDTFKWLVAQRDALVAQQGKAA